MQVTYGFESPVAPDGAALVFHLDEYLNSLYAPVDRHILTVEQLAEPGMRFLVARRHGEAVACGALAPHDDYMEIKRMWVEPNARGLGIAKQMLRRLEADASAAGCRELRLETGVHNGEAMALYEAMGYARIPCWGEYLNSPLSICYGKQIVPEQDIQTEVGG